HTPHGCAWCRLRAGRLPVCTEAADMSSCHDTTHCHHHNHDADAAAQVRDPVCGMWVDRNSAGHVAEHGGEAYYFCAAGCRQKFLADPDKYLQPQPEPEPLPAGTQYTCPMHPEVIQEGPGDCPKCGMALEPMGVPAGDEGPNPELVDFTRRFKV